MKTIAVAATAALIAAGSAVAFAQAPGPGAGPGAGPGTGPGGGPRTERLTREDMGALVDARVAAVRAGLKFTPEQEKLWQPVEAMIRKTAADRAARMETRRAEMEKLTPEQRRERMRDQADFGERLDRIGQRAEAMKAYADTMKPLWASLDERQKRLLPVLLRPAGRGQGMGWRGHHHRHGEHERINWRGDRQQP